MDRAAKRLIVRGLNRACELVDYLAYRPAIVKLTKWLPGWWHCQLSHLSMSLDARWKTGYWDSSLAPPPPEGICDACGRRAGWLVVGGIDSEDEDQDARDYLDEHPVHLCGWCQLDVSQRPRSRSELDRILREAAARSISWRWRWRPFA